MPGMAGMPAIPRRYAPDPNDGGNGDDDAGGGGGGCCCGAGLSLLLSVVAPGIGRVCVAGVAPPAAATVPVGWSRWGWGARRGCRCR